MKRYKHYLNVIYVHKQTLNYITFMHTKTIVVVVIFLWCFRLLAMEDFCQLVPYQNGNAYENGPLLDLKVALQAQLFNDTYCDLYAGNVSADNNEIIQFQLPDCDVNEAWEFAACLTRNYKAQHSQMC